MFKDPLTAWHGPFPYDVLAPVGVTPATTHSEMQDVSFDLMVQRLMTPETQTAWNELRTLQKRLLVDAVLWDVDPEAEIATARQELDEALSDPGEPPEVAACLAPPGADALDWLVEELDGVELNAPEPALPDEADDALSGAPVPPGLLDELIRFDR
ncbi:hypothetical protein DVA86_34785 [Streptomyces armeniacus]|uniref:Uncharacterized protein n=1 Tax=Streptomyces armeniacus TaxID=83291 RepID=A0A345XZ57_9ACTN|nr:hypothetical protein [Streptomyces armeniacus]AXK36923.1 hypothetical protein DVA86_34785 [Streptomyces armeniacus]